jgi:hypothetical protein
MGWPDLALMFGMIFHLDANRVNARGSLPNICELEKWHHRGVIALEWSAPVYDELAHDAPDGRHWNKISGSLVANPAITTPSEQCQLDEIEGIVFPGGTRDNTERNDALALFTAKKYFAIFVTNDGGGGKPRGILTHKESLASIGVRVVSDEEAVTMVRARLNECARTERQLAEVSGESEPPWISTWESSNKAV